MTVTTRRPADGKKPKNNGLRGAGGQDRKGGNAVGLWSTSDSCSSLYLNIYKASRHQGIKAGWRKQPACPMHAESRLQAFYNISSVQQQ